jgi:hypothetical protein
MRNAMAPHCCSVPEFRIFGTKSADDSGHYSRLFAEHRFSSWRPLANQSARYRAVNFHLP